MPATGEYLAPMGVAREVVASFFAGRGDWTSAPLRPTIDRLKKRVSDPTLNLTGSICALATPFRAAGDALDLDAFVRLIDYQIDSGTRGVVVAGSTGEGAALDTDEFAKLVEMAVGHANHRVPIFAGTGLQSTGKTIAQTRLAAAAGADIALVVTPAYVRPTQEGLYRHFCEIAEQGGLPLMLYNVPSRSACDLLPETVARLIAQAGIIGIKEALPAEERMGALLELRRDGFSVFSGDDPTCARAIGAGADGVISVAANVVPAAMQELCARAAIGDRSTTMLDAQLRPLYELLSAESNPIPLKWCLQQIGFGEAHPRLPLTVLTSVHHARARQALAALGLLEAARAAG